MSELDVTVGADARWVPLLLDSAQDVDAWAEQTARKAFALRDVAQPEVDELGHVSALLAGLARRTAALGEQTGDVPVLTAGAWVLAPDEHFHPLTVATLRVQPLDHDAVTDDVVAAVVQGAERHGPVEVEELATPSGPALRVTWRPVSRDSGEAEVDEQQAVLWPWPEHGLLLVLSSWWTDLVAAGRYSDALDDLAQLVDAQVVG